jgi:predicted  nucleic acid-binding Zn-ribbon protein
MLVIDAEVRGLTEQIEKARGERRDAQAEVAQLEKQLQQDREAVVEMDRTRGELTKELRNTTQQIERSRERLGRSRNEREVQAAERELDELRKLQRERDDEIVKLSDLASQARQSIEQNEARQNKLREHLEGTLAGAQEGLLGLEARLGECREKRQHTTAKLPPRLLRRYEALLTRRAVPIAKTVDGTCLGCHIQLPPMMFHQMLSRTQFEECPSCHRIIYYEPPADESPESDAQ